MCTLIFWQDEPVLIREVEVEVRQINRERESKTKKMSKKKKKKKGANSTHDKLGDHAS